MENSTDVAPWIEHLKDSNVLIAFAFFLLVSLVKVFRSEKISGKGTERLMDKGLNFVFILALLIICIMLLSKFMATKISQSNASAISNMPTADQQKSNNNKGIVLQSRNGVNANTTGGILSAKDPNSHSPEISNLNKSLNQEVNDNIGLVIQGGDTINYTSSLPVKKSE